MADRTADTARLLRSVADGEPGATEKLLPIVYEELRALAGRMMADQPRGHTLQATALVHEAYVRLVGQPDAEWEGRAHFLRVAARAMRYALVDHARGRGAIKRGRDRHKLTFDENACVDARDADYVLDLDDALERLGEFDPRLAQIVEMRFFAGLDNDEIARALEVSAKTVQRGWRLAQAWLVRAMGEDDER